MKFTIAVVMMALAVAAQASIVPLAYSLPYAAPYQYAPLSYTARSAAYAPAIQYAAAPAIQYAAAPAITYAAAPAPAIAYTNIQPYAELRSPAAIIPVAAEGTYTAVNKGAIHVAPLPGHSQSASSINLEPAPGTY